MSHSATDAEHIPSLSAVFPETNKKLEILWEGPDSPHQTPGFTWGKLPPPTPPHSSSRSPASLLIVYLIGILRKT